jgi:hypothetical protein
MHGVTPREIVSTTSAERAVLPQERVNEGGRDVQDDERSLEDR